MGQDELTGIHSGLQQLRLSVSALNVIMSRKNAYQYICVCQIISICIIIMYIFSFWVLYVVKILLHCLVTYVLLSLDL
jgi:hypothetical protein